MKEFRSKYIHARGGSRAAATSKMERFVIIVNGWEAFNYYHKTLLLGCCSSPRSASACNISSDISNKTNEDNLIFDTFGHSESVRIYYECDICIC